MSDEVEFNEMAITKEIFVGDKPINEKLDVLVEVEIEGKTHRWEKETISIHEIAELGGWAVSEGVLHIDADNNERSLAENEVVVIEVGIAFAKKVKFRRG